MLRMVLAQALRRRGRSLAVVAAVVVAAVSFSLLTSAVATSQLRVHGTVQANYRSAYDILVRPANSRTPLETSNRLIQENYLSGIYGGITLAQYHRIQQIPGVEVAAPIAMIGYMLPSLYLGFPINKWLSSDQQQVFRVTSSWTADRGLSTYPGATNYIYVDGARNAYKHDQEGCATFSHNLGAPQSAFDFEHMTGMICGATNPPDPGAPGFGGLTHGQIGNGYQYYFPVLLAAIDPIEEAKLVGLDKAVVSGRYLTPDDKTQLLGGPTADFQNQSVPVLMANQPLSDDSLSMEVQRLTLPDQSVLPSKLSSPTAQQWLSHLPGSTLHTYRMSDDSMYPRLLATYAKPRNLVQTQYWSPGQVDYRTAEGGHLAPDVRSNPDAATWSDPRLGFLAPPSSADVAFRRIQVHIGSNQIITNEDGAQVYASPVVHEVGVFDPSEIEGFSALSQVPLTTYYPPDAAPGNPISTRLLHGRSLLPSQNLAGYLQQPPMMLTTLKALHSFTDATAFSDTNATAKAPISVIRIRVAGVTGIDQTSLARVRLAAEQIQRQTGLDVDLTMGSSPHQELIDLPAGRYGRPPLVLSEGWVKKGVAVALLSAVDAKSLALFGLVLLVCLLFLVNATVAAVRTRRTELGVLACLGWPAWRIFALLESELLATGLAAGLLGTGLAGGIAVSLSLHVSWWQIALITPVATGLAALAGIGPVWRACSATPMEAITPAVRSPRRAARVGSVTRLAIVGLSRWPGRTILGAAALFVGVAALTALIAIQRAFQGGVVGTSLGDVVAIQVRGVDYLAAALTIALGALAVADITYLNISERTSEIGTLRSTGWADSHVRRLFATEGLLTAGVGAILGAVLSITAAALILPISLRTALIAATTAAAIGIASATLTLLLPLSRLAKLAPATAITDE